MKSFEQNNLSPEDVVLQEALRNVPIPAGLESRLLAAVANEPTIARFSEDDKKSSSRSVGLFSRRAWLASAAGLVGVSALSGFAYSRRKFSSNEVVDAVNNAWFDEKWSRTWQSMASAPPLSPPGELLRPRCWQCVETELHDETVTFDMTLPARPPAVLFAAKMWRDISHFDTKPAKPLIRSGPWNHVAIWRQARVLYVLASQGTAGDHKALFRGNGVVPLA